MSMNSYTNNVPQYQSGYYQPKEPSPTISRSKIYTIVAGIVVFFSGSIIIICTHFVFGLDADMMIALARVETVGKLFQLIGALVMSLGLVIGALLEYQLESNVRASMLMATGLIMALEMMLI
jgi:hypothetical protein